MRSFQCHQLSIIVMFETARKSLSLSTVQGELRNLGATAASEEKSCGIWIYLE